MTTIGNDMDYSELKQLAEAATAGPWKCSKGHVSHSATYNSEKENRMYAIEGPADVRDYEVWGYTKANATYMAAASPDVVLGLLAERDYFQKEVSMMKSEWNEFHHLMKKYGLHPGRTDDNLLDILGRDLEASKHGLHHLREKNVEARAERDTLRTQNQALLEALRIFESCAYAVASEINERRYNWSEAYLDQALPIARAAIKLAEGKDV